MPKEPRGDGQGCVGERERTPRPASKNAKDKSNSAALLASRGRVHTEQGTNGRDSRCSEKDSGYSGESMLYDQSHEVKFKLVVAWSLIVYLSQMSF